MRVKNIFYAWIIVSGLSCCKEPVNNLNSLEVVWKVPLSNGTETSSTNPVLYKNLVIYSADDGGIDKSKIIALNKETGQKVWEWRNTNESKGYISAQSTYIKDNVLVCPISGRPYQIVAINADNGEQLWHKTLPEAGESKIVGIDNLVFQIRGNYDRMKDEVFVADVRTGDWQSVFAATNIDAPIFIDQMFAYKGNNNRRYLTFLVAKYKDFSFQTLQSIIYKFDIDSNKMVYQRTLDFLRSTSNPRLIQIAADKLWLFGNPLIVLSENTADRLFEIPIPFVANTSGYFAVWNNTVFMPTTDKMFAFNATSGQQLWGEQGRTSGSPSRILYFDNRVYYTSGGDGKLHVLDANNGSTVADIKSPDKTASGQGGFDSAITLDTINRRIYTASYYGAICYKMPN